MLGKKKRPNLADVMERLARVEQWVAENEPSKAELDARKKDRLQERIRKEAAERRDAMNAAQKLRDQVHAEVAKVLDTQVRVDDEKQMAALLKLLGITENEYHKAVRTGRLRIQGRLAGYQFLHRESVAEYLLALRREREGVTA